MNQSEEREKGAGRGCFCSAHGGGYKCKHSEGCDKNATKGGFCIAHGGGNKQTKKGGKDHEGKETFDSFVGASLGDVPASVPVVSLGGMLAVDYDKCHAGSFALHFRDSQLEPYPTKKNIFIFQGRTYRRYF